MATIYRSTDTGAPSVNNAAGSLIGMLDAVLVNGYGSKPAAGWTKEFSGTNKAVYRNGASAMARSFFRIDDTGLGTPIVRGFKDMTDVDTGTGPFPSPSNVATPYWPKGNSTAARNWIAIADARTFVYFLQADGNNWGGGYWGDGESAYTGDNQFALQIANHATSSSYWWSAVKEAIIGTPAWSNSNAYTVRAPRGDGAPLLAQSGLSAFSIPLNFSSGAGYLAVPSDGRYFVAPMIVLTWAGSGDAWNYRGRLRFIWRPVHLYAGLTHGATFGGTGELQGKTFEIVKPVAYDSTPQQSVLAFTAND